MAFTKLTNGYVTYHMPNGTTSDVMFHTFKNIDAVNGYRVDRAARYAVNAVNFIIGRFIFWKNVHGTSEKGNLVIISNKDMAKNIGCSTRHVRNVFRSLERIFGLETYFEPGKGEARKVKLNRAFVEFFKVFNEDDYLDYIDEYKISDSKDLYTLRQVYEHRLFALKDKYLNKQQQASKQEFLEERRDYYHLVATSFVSVNKRIQNIKEYQDKISKREQSQFERIQEERKEGKLAFYFYMLLVKIENHVLAIKDAIKKALNRTNEDETTAFTDRNKTKGEQETTKQVSAVHKKEPDSEIDFKEDKAHEGYDQEETTVEYDENRTPSIKKAIMIITLWNLVADDAVPTVSRLTDKRYLSISKLISKYGYGKVIQAVRNTVKLYYDPQLPTKITLDRFLTHKTFEYVLHLKEFSPSVVHATRAKYSGCTFEYGELTHTCPDFHDIDQANTWLRENVLS